jgi:hypothetical protein
MRKYYYLIFVLCLSLFYSIPAISANRQAAMYQGLEPEIATLNDTIRILGTPISKRSNDKFIYCKYRTVEVAVEKKTGKIGIIIIYDQTFKDVNGFMIGDSYEKISNALNDAGKGNAIFDKKKNVIYVFNQDLLLEEIVYGVLSK